MDNVAAKKILPFPEQGAESWIHTYRVEVLQARDEATIEAYTRILEKFAAWLSLRPGNSGQFHTQVSREHVKEKLKLLTMSNSSR